LTTDTNKNPSFTVIEIDEEFMVPINFKTYYYDILKANRDGKITWELLHDFTHYYGLPDLRPDNIQAFADRLRIDEAFAILYKWNSVRQATG
jgi:Acid sphingomyelin phosphodiesterase C-terminal region